ncbi:MAG: N-acetyl-gamma-glutamyl-phosphate reductase [Candidatus Latescibacteria bacterium]|nr:N-acetyl-gamma-glutamyl-phosphate reductase [Candidatus Latescibacterota bacterium]
MIRIGIIGAAGYAGLALFRLLAHHPESEIVFLVSGSQAGKRLSEVFPQVTGIGDRELVSLADAKAMKVDVVFLCRAHTEAMALVPEFYERGIRVVDLSADFRMDTPEAYREWYHLAHTAPELLKTAVYGLPELYREQIKRARLVGNPGCYPTGAILALAPLLEKGWIRSDDVIVDAKSGVSGAGRKPSPRTHFVETNENIAPYNVGRVHRHTGEIEQELSKLAGEGCPVVFTPQLVPINKGILTTAYATLDKEVDSEELTALYKARYEAEPFVRVMEDGLPETRFVQDTNFCDVAVLRVGGTRKVLAITALDNLIKGAAGQAVQNMNLMCGIEETSGLW